MLHQRSSVALIEEQVGIGQAARFIQTPHGNVLWDLVAYLDEDTISQVEELGGLKMIVISHPHFYTYSRPPKESNSQANNLLRTWADWSATFQCPVYVSAVDTEWLNRQSHSPTTVKHLTDERTELMPGVTAHICGGHFPGSLVLNILPPNTAFPSLFVADTIFAVTSGKNPPPYTPKPGDGRISYSFLWSIPNPLPLSPDEILRIWKVLKKLDFQVTYGVMAKITNVYELEEDKEWGGLKRRVLESAKVAVRRMIGDNGHEMLEETM